MNDNQDPDLESNDRIVAAAKHDGIPDHEAAANMILAAFSLMARSNTPSYAVTYLQAAIDTIAENVEAEEDAVAGRTVQ